VSSCFELPDTNGRKSPGYLALPWHRFATAFGAKSRSSGGVHSHVLHEKRTGSLPILPGHFLEFGAIEVPPFEEPEWEFEDASFIPPAFKLLPAIGSRTRRLDFRLSRVEARVQDNPTPALRAGHARAHNVISHSMNYSSRVDARFCDRHGAKSPHIAARAIDQVRAIDQM
jgi:hypothetical protein